MIRQAFKKVFGATAVKAFEQGDTYTLVDGVGFSSLTPASDLDDSKYEPLVEAALHLAKQSGYVSDSHTWHLLDSGLEVVCNAGDPNQDREFSVVLEFWDYRWELYVYQKSSTPCWLDGSEIYSPARARTTNLYTLPPFLARKNKARVAQLS
jgi:hypothetical protein